MTWLVAMPSEDLFEDELVGLELGGERVLVVRLAGGVHAYADRCAHQGHRVSDGALRGSTLACPVHGWTYDVRTGEGENPRGARLVPLAVKEERGDILVELAEPSIARRA